MELSNKNLNSFPSHPIPKCDYSSIQIFLRRFVFVLCLWVMWFSCIVWNYFTTKNIQIPFNLKTKCSATNWLHWSTQLPTRLIIPVGWTIPLGIHISLILFATQTDRTQFASTVLWLEDQKIRHYTIEDRDALRQIGASTDWLAAWDGAYAQYKRDVNMPVADSPLEELSWLMSYAVRLEYLDHGNYLIGLANRDNYLKPMILKPRNTFT